MNGIGRVALLFPIFLGLSHPPPAPADAPTTSTISTTLDALRARLSAPRAARADLSDDPIAKIALSRAEADEARSLLWEDHVAQIRDERAKEWNDQAIAVGDHVLRFKQRHFGERPMDGWNLFISLHGGGGAPAALNDQQWENQIQLYQPKDSLYIAPRAPANNWNLWHEAHVDGLLDRLIEDAIVLGSVNPDRVYIMGYSAGGDGVYQLAPRMADRWAAASMMAGHPNDASPLGLRNIGFTIHVGALDSGYDRNKVALRWGDELDALQKADPAGYVHEVKLHPCRGHWMNLEDREAVDWMARFKRDPLPDRIVWKQSTVTHDRFYWLELPPGQAAGGQLIIATRKQQTITIEKAEGIATLKILLCDAMANLDQPITVQLNGKELFHGPAPRTIGSLCATLASRGDPDLMFDATVTVKLAN